MINKVACNKKSYYLQPLYSIKKFIRTDLFKWLFNNNKQNIKEYMIKKQYIYFLPNKNPYFNFKLLFTSNT